MKRYWLFAGSNYYPSGGMEDFKECSDSLDYLKGYILRMEFAEWAHIYDFEKNKIILVSHESLSSQCCNSNFTWREE